MHWLGLLVDTNIKNPYIVTNNSFNFWPEKKIIKIKFSITDTWIWPRHLNHTLINSPT